jgi:hypothetical protein
MAGSLGAREIENGGFFARFFWREVSGSFCSSVILLAGERSGEVAVLERERKEIGNGEP